MVVGQVYVGVNWDMRLERYIGGIWSRDLNSGFRCSDLIVRLSSLPLSPRAMFRAKVSN